MNLTSPHEPVSAPNAQAETVEISIGQHSLASIPARYKDLLAPELSYHTKEISESDGQVEVRDCREQAFSEEESGEIIFPVGCVARVRHVLERAGYQVVVRDLRRFDSRAHTVDHRGAFAAEANARQFAEVLANFTEGIIAARPGKARAACMAAIGHLLPSARIFVASARVDDCQFLADALRNNGLPNVAAVRGGNWSSNARIVCGTYTSFDTSYPWDFDALIFEDGVEALGKKTHESRPRYGNHRVYAFADPDLAYSDAVRLKLEILAGPQIYLMHGEPLQQLSPKVGFAGAPDEMLKKKKDPRQRREQLWSAPQRNQMIAEIAEACAARDPEPLGQYELFLDEADPFHRYPIAPRTVILTESVEHAQALSQLLPEWTLLDGRPEQIASENGWSRAGVLPDLTIITNARAEKLKTFNPQTLIVASGGPSVFLPSGFHKSSQDTIIIDIDDPDPYSRDTAARKADYRRFGFELSN